MEGTFAAVTKELQARPPRTANALKVLERRGHCQGSNRLEVQLDNQIGMIHFMQQDFGGSRPTSNAPDGLAIGWAP